MAERKPAKRKAEPKEKESGKLYAAVPLSYQGAPIEVGAEVHELLPAEVLEACLERGEVTDQRMK